MQDTTTAALAGEDRMERWPPQRRNLAAACLAHFLHDDYTDQLYALLPVWQPEFGLFLCGVGASPSALQRYDGHSAGASGRTSAAQEPSLERSGMLIRLN